MNTALCRIEQKEDRQLDSLAGITVDEIIVEKTSGKNFTGREKYQQMKSQLRTGDLVIVKSIDRFGRNYTQICKEWESIINMGVDIQVLDMPIRYIHTVSEEMDAAMSVLNSRH